MDETTKKYDRYIYIKDKRKRPDYKKTRTDYLKEMAYKLALQDKKEMCVKCN